jgi:hypothetical protein
MHMYIYSGQVNSQLNNVAGLAVVVGAVAFDARIKIPILQLCTISSPPTTQIASCVPR